MHRYLKSKHSAPSSSHRQSSVEIRFSWISLHRNRVMVSLRKANTVNIDACKQWNGMEWKATELASKYYKFLWNCSVLPFLFLIAINITNKTGSFYLMPSLKLCVFLVFFSHKRLVLTLIVIYRAKKKHWKSVIWISFGRFFFIFVLVIVVICSPRQSASHLTKSRNVSEVRFLYWIYEISVCFSIEFDSKSGQRTLTLMMSIEHGVNPETVLSLHVRCAAHTTNTFDWSLFRYGD